MSVIAKNMEMPTSCDKCRFCVNGFTDDAPMYECAVQSEDMVSVLVESGGKPFDFRPDWCPLVDIPTPHGRLGDLDELKTAFPICDNSMDIKIASVRATINHAPTIIEAEGETDA